MCSTASRDQCKAELLNAQLKWTHSGGSDDKTVPASQVLNKAHCQQGLRIPFSGVQPFSGNALMPTRGILEFGKKMVVKRVVTKSVFRISRGLVFYSQNTLIVVPPAFLCNITPTTTLSYTNNVDDTNNVDSMWQHISHDGDKGVDITT
jgi:hypothetical protein